MKELLRKYLPDDVKYLTLLLYSLPLALIYKIFSFFPIKRNKIIVRSYDGKGIGDNPKYIIEELIKGDEELEIYWLIKKGTDKNSTLKSVKLININSIRALYETATAGVWISNTRIPLYMKKRKEQYYIQTWHGGLGLKRVEGAAIQNLSKFYIKTAKDDSEKADLFISNSKYRTNLYREYFWYDKEILEVGLPRNDKFINLSLTEEKKIEVNDVKNLENKIVVLYAPTFRRNHSIDSYNIDFERLKNEIESIYNKECVIMIRFHQIVSDLSKELVNKYDFIIDTTKISDVFDVLKVTDILISDYSSIMFDFMLLNRPILIYASDIVDYKKDRDFMIDINTTPFSISVDNDELIENIKQIKDIDFYEKYNEFNERFGVNETGKSSKIIADIILKEIKGFRR